MALSCRASFTGGSTTPFPQKQTSERVKPTLLPFKPNLTSTQNWSIAQNHTLPSAPLKYSKTVDIDDFDIEHAQNLKMVKHILRKEGEDPFQGVFENFKNKEGRFKQKLSSDIVGLMSLYEASQLSIKGEDVLDEAGDYSYRLLSSSMRNLDYNQARFVGNSLDHPHHKSLASFMAKNFFNDWHEKNGWINMLQELAKIDFMMVQSQHQHELVEIAKWWKDLGLSKELKFARDQPLKCDKIYKEHGWNPVDSLRKTWVSLCNAFLVEARWFASGKLPSAEEYLKNGIVSSGVHVVLVHIFFLLGQGISKEKVELIDHNPGIISSTATILRLWDDLGSAKDENQDGNDGSYVECYMKEHKGSAFEDAQNRVLHMISEAWKQLNEECLSPNPFSATFSKASLNIARMVPVMYNYDGNHRLPNLEEHMKSLLYENVSL
ncbi:unnamed protein product [Dovyalis caffra]|uniref:Uncharacterized protein n=1 Tax=Dovyalis caffra TaxID=77055 RepID=A0AAV1SHG5_9ROSI|nr:unnamed protein product [Dovyalis caffra]